MSELESARGAKARAEAAAKDAAREAEFEAARLVCLMVGWTASDNSDRGKALHELWAEWKRRYEANGGSHEPRKHPELSDARIRELAAQRDATRARTLGHAIEPAS